MWSMSPAPSSLSVPPFLGVPSSPAPGVLGSSPSPPPQAAAVSASVAARATVVSPLRFLSNCPPLLGAVRRLGISRSRASPEYQICPDDVDVTPSAPDSSHVTQLRGRDVAGAPRDRDGRVTPRTSAQGALNRQIPANSS